jgi:hypothetical protein
MYELWAAVLQLLEKLEDRSVRGKNDSDDSILDEGDIVEADITRGVRNNRLLREIAGLLQR